MLTNLPRRGRPKTPEGVIREIHDAIQDGMLQKDAVKKWGIHPDTFRVRAKELGLPSPFEGPDVSTIDPETVVFSELLVGSKMKFLRLHPGCWFLVGTKLGRGGFSSYVKVGFKHSVRRAGEEWDHYLSWPIEEA